MDSRKDNGQQEIDIIQTKNKRDQYVMEIRKSKVDELIRAKRIKLAKNINLNKENTKPNKNFGEIEGENMQVHEELPSFEKLTTQFFEAVQNDNVNLLLSVVISIRKKLSVNENPPLQEFIETGLFPHLIKFLNEEYASIENLQFEILWIVSNSFSGTPEQSNKLLTDSLLKTLVKFIWDKRIEIVDTVNLPF